MDILLHDRGGCCHTAGGSTPKNTECTVIGRDLDRPTCVNCVCMHCFTQLNKDGKVYLSQKIPWGLKDSNGELGLFVATLNAALPAARNFARLGVETSDWRQKPVHAQFFAVLLQ